MHIALGRIFLPDLIKGMMPRTSRKYKRAIETLFSFVDEIIAKRKSDPSASEKYDDFLQAMLDKEDAKTGKKLTLENIRFQIITFLIAGHDSTSSFLANTFTTCLRTKR